ncbi:hypothetical protein NQ318_015967 [Aromia moschata]|uniref:DNA-directed DNA polymerase n=1 Tax=Aromia moschata TaxID=1265417 RepID=A0AAV8X3L5_9CUCU|nr:hypothetical protein NQ318_015967 [Aromia moschata]
MPLAKLPKAFGIQGVKRDISNTFLIKRRIGIMLVPYRISYIMTQIISKYCISDVDILAKACLKFRELMMKEGGVDPFTEAVTLPGACNKIFRRNFLRPDTIGLIPKNGYRWRDNQSLIAIQWLVWEERQLNINILHAAKGSEALVAGVKVDGYCPDTNQVFEFHGCYYHGCPRCIKYRRNDYTYDDPTATVESRYEATVLKTQRLNAFGYTVIEMWECDFRKMLKNNDEIRKYTENHPLVATTPLNPRDAFYGVLKMAKKIKYVDVCSLYPYVNKYGKYPVGHPEVLVGDDCKNLDLNQADGLIKCKILPPSDLYHPVLPTKMNNKLMFVLCRTCGEELNALECCHNDEDRALTGTWVIDEVVKAVEKGYAILEIYEVWKYQVERYNPELKSGGLFSDYISTFLKIKQQASGWPASCVTSEDKVNYVTEYLEREGVTLCPEEIDTNPGGRQIGKSVITSFWGKLGQRENQAKTSIVTDPAEFFDIPSRPFIEVISVYPVNENTLVVNWQYKYEAYDVLPTVNVVLAAYTTSQARLKLYSYLEKLDNRVLYHDTDSVIYISSPGGYDVPIGSFLGEMTDELTDYGPVKVKGITLNYNTIKEVNFNSLRDMVLNDANPKYITTRNILRTSDHSVITREVTKIFRPNFLKRRRESDYNSVPYGYKHAKLSNKKKAQE